LDTNIEIFEFFGKNIETCSEYVLLIDADDESVRKDLIKENINSIKNCSLACIFGAHSDDIECVVDNLIEISVDSGGQFVPTVSTQELDDAVSILLNWRTSKPRRIGVISRRHEKLLWLERAIASFTSQ